MLKHVNIDYTGLVPYSGIIDNSFGRPFGCISTKICHMCGITIEIDSSSGKKLPRVENGKAYVGGPCLCGPTKCPNCDFIPTFNTTNYKDHELELVRYSSIPYSD